MNADVKGALEHIKNGGKGWRAFSHKDKSLTRAEVVRVLEYAQNMGYQSTGELTDDEVDKVLEEVKS